MVKAAPPLWLRTGSTFSIPQWLTRADQVLADGIERMLHIPGPGAAAVPASGHLPGNRLSIWHRLSFGRWRHQAHVDYVES